MRADYVEASPLFPLDDINSGPLLTELERLEDPHLKKSDKSTSNDAISVIWQFSGQKWIDVTVWDNSATDKGDSLQFH